MFTEIGKFTSIAAGSPESEHHPWWRPTLHHYPIAPKYQLGEDPTSLDDEVFSWREEDKVQVGHDVWIGHGVIVLPGITIGNGSIVGAGSVVTKDVPPYSIVVGNPAKVLRLAFDEPSYAERLESLEWWH